MPSNNKFFKQTGVTLVEIVVTICVILIVSVAIFQVFNERVSQSNNDSESSQYYLDFGLFAEAMNSDLAMTHVIQPLPNGISLSVRPDGNEESIIYSLNENTIERKFRGKKKIFRFTNPNRKESPLIFRIEEVKP
jgi:type II secretory pathway pseudopilin PulG